MGLLVLGVAPCWEDEKPIGMTLLFQSAGMPVGVLRFDPDGMRGPVPGAVGGMSPRGGAIMSFMPGDSKHGVPRFVDVEWMVATENYRHAREVLNARSDRYSEKWIEDSKRINQEAPRHLVRKDLTKLITRDLVEQVRTNNQNTQLRLVVTFNNDEVDIKAEAYKWR